MGSKFGILRLENRYTRSHKPVVIPYTPLFLIAPLQYQITTDDRFDLDSFKTLRVFRSIAQNQIQPAAVERGSALKKNTQDLEFE